MSLPRYESYKDSGVEWLGEVPSHWATKRFGRAVKISEGQVDPSVEPYASMILIAPNHIESGTGRLLNTETASEQGAESGKYSVLLGDVVYSKIRPALAKATMAPCDGLCSADMYPLRCIDGMAQNYLKWTMLNPAVTAWTVLESDRVAMPKINREKLSELRLPIPPLSEQSAIAAFLDRETAKIDALIEAQERLIELLKEKRQAVISHAVTKGLDSSVPMKDSGIDWLGEVPAHWDVLTIGRICEGLSYGFTNPMPIGEHGPYMLTANDIGEGKIRYDSARRTTWEAFNELLTEKSRPVVGDILITKDGTLGRIAVFDGQIACINQSVAFLRVNPRLATPQYTASALAYGIYNERMIYEAGGTTIKHIYISRLAKMPLALPPLPEMAEITAYCEVVNRKANELTFRCEATIALLQERRAALIAAAVTGKIDVRGLVDTSEAA